MTKITYVDSSVEIWDLHEKHFKESFKESLKNYKVAEQE
jgi:hypothetical protein